MSEDTAEIKIRCNLPKGYRGKVHFVFGINDEKIGEGYNNDIVSLVLPIGIHDILVLVSDEGLNSMTGTTRIGVYEETSFKLKYSFFSKKARLILDK